jgi:hypothetical protein
MPAAPPPPTQASLLQSLSDAATAAHDAYTAALAANPGADLGVLYQSSLDAQTIYLTALNQTFNADPAVNATQAQLDAAVTQIKNQLATLTNIVAWTNLAANLVQLATTVAGFFA